MPKNRNIIGLLVLVVVILVGSFGIDYVQAYGRGTSIQQWGVLNRIAYLIRENYVEEVEQKKLIDGAIEGMLMKLDPHSTYILPEDSKLVQERFEGEFEGIGIHFDIINNILTVLSPIPGSPAYAVGLQPGDKIVKIEGKSAIGIKSYQVMEKLKGPKGTKVRVTVRREGEENLLEFTITRDKIDIPSVQPAFMIRPGVAYIKITRFSKKTAEEFDEALHRLKENGMEKLILNLINNGGGYLDQAVAVAQHFIDKEKMIVYTQGRRSNSSDEHRSQREIAHEPYPIIILINNVSASASEIVAGALQDHDLALIAGQTSFGKGLVQNKFDLKNGGAVLLTVARYYTPSGRLIQRPYTEDRVSYIQEAGTSQVDSVGETERPVYYTMNLRRKVYGGGGIAPDVVLTPDTMNVFERRLNRHNVLFEFANRYVGKHRTELNDLETFIESFHTTEEDIEEIKRFIQDKGIEGGEAAFRESRDFIRRIVMQEIALSRWGREALVRVQASLSPEVQKALGLFDQASSILARSEQGTPDAASSRVPETEERSKAGRIR